MVGYHFLKNTYYFLGKCFTWKYLFKYLLLIMSFSINFPFYQWNSPLSYCCHVCQVTESIHFLLLLIWNLQKKIILLHSVTTLLYHYRKQDFFLYVMGHNILLIINIYDVPHSVISNYLNLFWVDSYVLFTYPSLLNMPFPMDPLRSLKIILCFPCPCGKIIFY